MYLNMLSFCYLYWQTYFFFKKKQSPQTPNMSIWIAFKVALKDFSFNIFLIVLQIFHKVSTLSISI